MDQNLSLEQVEAFRSNYASSPMSQVMTRAASKTALNDICYSTEAAARMNHKFSVEVTTHGITDQKSSGRCWLFAALNILREEVCKDLNLDSFELSQSYLSFYDHLEKANSFLEKIIETAAEPLDDRKVYKLLDSPVGDGGWWEYFQGLCRKYGVVPKEAMKETYQSSNTASMNGLISMQLRQYAMDIRREMAEGASAQQIREEKPRMLNKIYNILAICLGEPPVRFDFEYVDKDKAYHADRDLTPKAFFDKYIHRDVSSIVSILTCPGEDRPYGKTFVIENEESIRGQNPVKALNLSLEDFKAAVIRQLQGGDPIWFSCDCHPYGYRKEGIWDTEIFDFATPFDLDIRMTKEELLKSHESAPNHVMLLTGVNLVDGKPDKWKIENSWGDEWGHKGYYIMSDRWFDLYVYFACIDRKYLTEQQNRDFDQEPLVLAPWDRLA